MLSPRVADALLNMGDFFNAMELIRVMSVCKWFCDELPRRVRCLSTGFQDAPLALFQGPHFMPRSYWRRLSGVQKLVLSLFDEDSHMKSADGSDYYVVVPAMLGHLLEAGYFPKLICIRIEVGYHHIASPEIFTVHPDELEGPFSCHGWLPTLVLCIARAIQTKSTPFLFNVIIEDNYGARFFDSPGPNYGERVFVQPLNLEDDAKIRVARAALTQATNLARTRRAADQGSCHEHSYDQVSAATGLDRVSAA